MRLVLLALVAALAAARLPSTAGAAAATAAAKHKHAGRQVSHWRLAGLQLLECLCISVQLDKLQGAARPSSPVAVPAREPPALQLRRQLPALSSPAHQPPHGIAPPRLFP